MANTIQIVKSPEEYQNPTINYKVIFIGETGVGKTCIMLRASRNDFNIDHTITLAADFANYYLLINNIPAKLQLWDTCGLEMYKSMIRVFFKGSDAGLLVFDVSNAASFASLGSWLKELREYTSPELLCYLIGNKVDIEERVITESQAEKFVSDNGLTGYFETSAKSGYGIQELINKIAKELFEKKGINNNDALKLEENTEGGSGCQC